MAEGTDRGFSRKRVKCDLMQVVRCLGYCGKDTLLDRRRAASWSVRMLRAAADSDKRNLVFTERAGNPELWFRVGDQGAVFSWSWRKD